MEIKLIYIIYSVIIVNSARTSSFFVSAQLPEDAKLNFTQLGAKYGHKVDEHTVVTEDGYILTVFRIPGKRKTPVFLMHGTGDSSDTYILRGKESWAVSLANEGYDVWAGNARGNYYSRRHVKLNADTDPSFWNFSFHERGYYDLAAMVDYVLKATGEKSLQSIGHSQGTLNHFVLLSSRPEYNDKFKTFIALAPIAFLNNLITPMSFFGVIGPTLDLFLPSILNRVVDVNSLERSLINFICTKGEISYFLCLTLITFPLTGSDPARLEPSFLPTLISHYPSAMARKDLIHHNQLITSKRFSHYDYGSEENMKRYGSPMPPDYNLKNVTAKIALIYGNNDNLSRPRDVEYLRTLLPNVVENHFMEQKEWNHMDFVYSRDLPQTLFPYVFGILEKYN